MNKYEIFWKNEGQLKWEFYINYHFCTAFEKFNTTPIDAKDLFILFCTKSKPKYHELRQDMLWEIFRRISEYLGYVNLAKIDDNLYRNNGQYKYE